MAGIMLMMRTEIIIHIIRMNMPVLFSDLDMSISPMPGLISLPILLWLVILEVLGIFRILWMAYTVRESRKRLAVFIRNSIRPIRHKKFPCFASPEFVCPFGRS